MIILGQKRDMITYLGSGGADIVLRNDTEVWADKGGDPAYLLGVYDRPAAARNVIATIATQYNEGARLYDMPPRYE